MAIKFATDIINEIKARGSINVPQGRRLKNGCIKMIFFIADTTSTEKISQFYEYG